MFAFCFFDKLEKKIIIARDRYGIKPIYYSLKDNLFIFASEYKSILAHPRISKSFNSLALKEYLTFQNIISDKTLHKDVQILMPGNYLEFDTQLKKLSITKYWDYKFTNNPDNLSQKEAEEELSYLFERAISRQLVSDVEIGSYLSGGVDSGSIACLTSKAFDRLKTFTIGFDLSSASGIELSYDERSKAEELSSLFKTDHYERVLNAGDMERSLSNLSYHIEEPRVGQSYPNYYAAELASNFVKVVMSGAGGDELFAGYPWRYFSSESSKDIEEFSDSYYSYWQRMLHESELKKITKPINSQVSNFDPKDIFNSILKGSDQEVSNSDDFLNLSLYFEAKTFLHGILVIEDKLSMSHGLETRVPFLDNDIVDFAMHCPIKMKLRESKKSIDIDENNPKKYIESNKGKKILRQVLSNYVPEHVSNRKKQGFSSPDASWFKGESIDFVKKKIMNKNALLYDYLDYESVNNLLDDHLTGKKNRRLFIWSMISIEEYLLHFN